MKVCWRDFGRTLTYRWPMALKSLVFSAGNLLFHRRTCSPASTTGEGFDIVTVVYGAELLLLDLQARSLARYLEPDFDGTIFIVVNDLCPARVTRRIERDVLPRYGHWRPRVRIVPFHHVSRGLGPSNGWVFQQALKLAIANRVDKPFYVVLDAKNHAIKPLGRRHFISPQGRAIQRLSHEHQPLRHYAEACAGYFGLKGCTQQPLTPCPPATPFVMHTQSTRELVAHVEAKERMSIFRFFRRTPFMAEFILYGYFLHVVKRERLADLYEDGPALSATVWPGGYALDDTMAKASTNDAIRFFGVHREVLKTLPAQELAGLQSFLRDKGLLAANETLTRACGQIRISAPAQPCSIPARSPSAAAPSYRHRAPRSNR